MWLRVWDLTSDIALPVFLCLAASDDSVEPELGSGCHADAEIALARALTEAAQARLTRISVPPLRLRGGKLPALGAVRPSRGGAALAAHAGMPELSHAAPSCAGASLRDDLDVALARLSRAGFGHVAYVDLTRPEFAIPVARVIIPGLEGP